VREPRSGNLNGTFGADQLCYIEAVQNEEPGGFLAFLSGTNRPLHSIIREEFRHLPIVNTRVCHIHLSYGKMIQLKNHGCGIKGGSHSVFYHL